MLLSLLLQAFLIATCAARRFGPGAKQLKYASKYPRAVPHQRIQSTSILEKRDVIAPKFFIFNLFESEAGSFYDGMPSLFQDNITVPGASPLFPDAHCTRKGDVCQMTLGEGEINAASSTTALIYSGLFDLTKTYFMVAGIAGINPHRATTGSATFPRYAVQFDLQYEIDSRQLPSNDSSSYFPQFATSPDEEDPSDYPNSVYGTEAFELNVSLRNRFFKLAKTNKLADSKAAQKYRKTYGYAPANQPPAVVKCATGTSNVYWSGSVLGEAFEAYTKLLTNGSNANYCATQQEDNAVLEALLRGDLANKTDFARVSILRTASDFDRAPPGETEAYHLLYANQEGFEISIDNLYIAAGPIIKDVLKNWSSVYEGGVQPSNFIGDIFNSLGLPNRDFGVVPSGGLAFGGQTTPS